MAGAAKAATGTDTAAREVAREVGMDAGTAGREADPREAGGGIPRAGQTGAARANARMQAAGNSGPRARRTISGAA